LNVLIADDEASIVEVLQDDLRDGGHKVFSVRDGLRALDTIKRESVDCLITDLNMPGLGGMALLEQAKKLNPALHVIVMTGYATIESAVQAMKLGAADYIPKPFLNQQVVSLVDKIGRIRDLESENSKLKEEIVQASIDNVVGRSKAMLDVVAAIKTIAKSESTVLITGETGTGKEVVARAVHRLSGRRSGPLVPLSCAAVPHTLLEDELFGHEKGSFTGADRRREGIFERAQGGIVFLDDIDDVPLDTQVKLLRVLQEREFERIGGEKSIKADVRVIAATKIDLRRAVDAGSFRSDLYYRLNVVPIALPPLRQRHGDVPVLARHFIAKYGGGHAYSLDDDTIRAMEAYDWPGNVRELEHAVERAIAFAGDDFVLKREHLVPAAQKQQGGAAGGTTGGVITLKEHIETAEKEHLLRMLAHTKGHKAHAAGLLGISRKSLWEKLRYHRLSQESNGE
jgi:DNA-binding NtrC family response regulator